MIRTIKILSPIAFVAVWLFSACNGSEYKASGGSVIEGKINGAGGQTVVLQRFVNNKAQDMDSAKVNADGSFSISPSFSMPMDYYSLSVRPSNEFVILLSDSTENVVINGDLEDLQNNAQVNGSPNTALLHQFYRKIEEFDKQIDAAKKAGLDAVSRGEDGSAAQNETSRLIRERRQYSTQFLRDESPSPAILAALSELNINVDLVLFDKAYSELKDNFGHSFYHRMVGEQIRQAKLQAQARQKAEQQQAQQQQQTTATGGLAMGAVAPDISMSDPKGKTRKLSDLRGKYVLIDFWASWCAPCRRENPNVVRLYEQYKSKGFEIFSVSLDNSADRWVAAIQQDNLTWPNHVSDLAGWKNAAAQQYGVHSIPQTVLLDPDGKITGIGLRGPALEARLKELLGS